MSGEEGSAINVLGGQYEFETIGNTYRYVLPSQKDWLQIGMNALFLVAFAALFLSGDLFTVLSHGFGQIDRRLLLVDGIIVVVLAVNVLDLLYQVMGKEIVEISDEAVVVRHQIFGIGPSRRTPAAKVSGLFVSQQKDQIGFRFGGSRNGFFDFGGGRVALRGGKDWLGVTRSYRFGASLGETEARQLAAQILSRFPQYRGAEGNPHA